MSRHFLLWILPVWTWLAILLAILSTDGRPFVNKAFLDNNYYSSGQIQCLRCPAGTFVKEECKSPDTQGICEPCLPGYTYSEGPTGLRHCLSCTLCREDQEVESACTTTHNAVCRCKRGTFCPPDHPCEVCLSCKDSCPPGQELQFPCNSTSDGQCTPSENGTWLHWLWFLVVAVGILIVVVIYLYKRKENYLRPKMFLCISKLCPGPPIEESIKTNLLSQHLTFPEGTNSEEQEEIFRKSWYTFMDEVPIQGWCHFMRRLGLSDNEICEAKENNPNNVKEQQYAMLGAWYQTKGERDVNHLLCHLRSIQMQAAASQISYALVQNELYILQEVFST